MIIAKKLTLIQKNPGVRIDYTHVQQINNAFLSELSKEVLIIEGETEDSFGLRKYSYDKIPIENLELMIVEFHVPKV